MSTALAWVSWLARWGSNALTASSSASGEPWLGCTGRSTSGSPPNTNSMSRATTSLSTPTWSGIVPSWSSLYAPSCQTRLGAREIKLNKDSCLESSRDLVANGFIRLLASSRIVAPSPCYRLRYRGICPDGTGSAASSPARVPHSARGAWYDSTVPSE